MIIPTYLPTHGVKNNQVKRTIKRCFSKKNINFHCQPSTVTSTERQQGVFSRPKPTRPVQDENVHKDERFPRYTCTASSVAGKNCCPSTRHVSGVPPFLNKTDHSRHEKTPLQQLEGTLIVAFNVKDFHENFCFRPVSMRFFLLNACTGQADGTFLLPASSAPASLSQDRSGSHNHRAGSAHVFATCTPQVSTHLFSHLPAPPPTSLPIPSPAFSDTNFPLSSKNFSVTFNENTISCYFL